MNQLQLYDLADALQIELRVNKDRSIQGGKPRMLRFGELAIPAPCEVISAIGPFSGVGVLVRVLHKLGLFATADGPKPIAIRVYLLDLSKIDFYEGVGLFERERPNDIATAVKLISHAVVASFMRTTNKAPWLPCS